LKDNNILSSIFKDYSNLLQDCICSKNPTLISMITFLYAKIAEFFGYFGAYNRKSNAANRPDTETG